MTDTFTPLTIAAHEQIFRGAMEALATNTPLRPAMSAFLDWCDKARCPDSVTDASGGDLLLFEWGTYDLGEGECLNVTASRFLRFPEALYMKHYEPEEWSRILEEFGEDDLESQEIEIQCMICFAFDSERFQDASASGEMMFEPGDFPDAFRSSVLASPPVAILAAETADTVFCEVARV